MVTHESLGLSFMVCVSLACFFFETLTIIIVVKIEINESDCIAM